MLRIISHILPAKHPTTNLVCMDSHTHTYIGAHTRAHSHTYTDTRMNTHTHKHTQSGKKGHSLTAGAKVYQRREAHWQWCQGQMKSNCTEVWLTTFIEGGNRGFVSMSRRPISVSNVSKTHTQVPLVIIYCILIATRLNSHKKIYEYFFLLIFIKWDKKQSMSCCFDLCIFSIFYLSG